MRRVGLPDQESIRLYTTKPPCRGRELYDSIVSCHTNKAHNIRICVWLVAPLALCRSWHQVYQATSNTSNNLNTNHFRSRLAWNIKVDISIQPEPELKAGLKYQSWYFGSPLNLSWTQNVDNCLLCRSISLHHVGHDQLHQASQDQTDTLNKKGGGSLGKRKQKMQIIVFKFQSFTLFFAGSSPQISLTSNSSSRSITPRLDSDTSIWAPWSIECHYWGFIHFTQYCLIIVGNSNMKHVEVSLADIFLPCKR